MTDTPTRPARRVRHDGWTEDRKAAFATTLARGGTVAAAAASVGMSRRSAYRLRVRPDGADVAAAWGNASPPPTAEEFDAIIDRVDTHKTAANEALSNVALRRALRAELRRERRRAWAAARRTNARENPVVVRRCVTFTPTRPSRLRPPGDDPGPSPGGQRPAVRPKKPVVVRTCVTFTRAVPVQNPVALCTCVTFIRALRRPRHVNA